MNQNEKYQYNFQYSLAHYQPLQIDQDQTTDQFSSNDQQIILRRSNQLIEFRCFLDKKIQQQIKTLFVHYLQLYGKVAVRLFRICQKIFQQTQITSSNFIRNHQSSLQNEREKLVESIIELSNVFYNEKHKYYKLICLCVSSSIFKILTLQKDNHELKFQKVFHSTYWEITGTHSTNQMLKKLLSDTFNETNFQTYLVNETPIKLSNLKMTKSLIRSSICNQNFISMNQSLRDKEDQKSQIRDSKMKQQISFSKKIRRKQKMNKQNQIQGSNEIYEIRQQEKEEKVKNQKMDYFYNSQKNGIQQQNSNHKQFNFKKDRMAIFENYSKSKSSKKMQINNFNQPHVIKKKTTFASYLQQKKLNF